MYRNDEFGFDICYKLFNSKEKKLQWPKLQPVVEGWFLTWKGIQRRTEAFPCVSLLDLKSLFPLCVRLGVCHMFFWACLCVWNNQTHYSSGCLALPGLAPLRQQLMLLFRPLFQVLWLSLWSLIRYWKLYGGSHKVTVGKMLECEKGCVCESSCVSVFINNDSQRVSYSLALYRRWHWSWLPAVCSQTLDG